MQDQGTGIPDDVAQRALEPFYTTKSGGTGLGLAIAARIVRGHHGRIELTSRPEGGTVVSIALPLRAAQETADDSAA